MKRFIGVMALFGASACASMPAAEPGVASAPVPVLEAIIDPDEQVTLFASTSAGSLSAEAASKQPLFKVCSAGDSSMPVTLVMSPDKVAFGDHHPSVRRETLAPGQCLFASAADIEARPPPGAGAAAVWLNERISALQAELPSEQRDEKLRFFGDTGQPVAARITIEPVAG
jgi:hypothetical protein